MGLSVMSVFMCMWPCGGLVNCPGFKTYFIQWCAGIGCGPDTQIRKDKGRKELMNIVHLRFGKSSQNTLCGELSRVKSGNDSPKSLHSLQNTYKDLSCLCEIYTSEYVSTEIHFCSVHWNATQCKHHHLCFFAHFQRLLKTQDTNHGRLNTSRLNTCQRFSLLQIHVFQFTLHVGICLSCQGNNYFHTFLVKKEKETNLKKDACKTFSKVCTELDRDISGASVCLRETLQGHNSLN